MNNSKSTVLIIDDENSALEHHVRMLEREGFEVQKCDGPDSAMEAVSESKPDAILLDVMMPPGSQYSNTETEDGLMTGVRLYRDLITRIDASTPVIIFTGLIGEVADAIPSQLPQGYPYKVIRKVDYPPLELAELVREMISDSRGD